jgi:hypothetical protein
MKRWSSPGISGIRSRLVGVPSGGAGATLLPESGRK